MQNNNLTGWLNRTKSYVNDTIDSLVTVLNPNEQFTGVDYVSRQALGEVVPGEQFTGVDYVSRQALGEAVPGESFTGVDYVSRQALGEAVPGESFGVGDQEYNNNLATESFLVAYPGIFAPRRFLRRCRYHHTCVYNCPYRY